MSHLEQVLRELEIATAAAVAIAMEDIEGTHAVLKRRSEAIAGLAALRDAALALPSEARDGVIGRLEAAVKAGEEAQRQLARSKGRVTAEWTRWNQVRRALGSSEQAGATKIDCRG